MTRESILKAFPTVYDHPGMFDFSPPEGWLTMIYELSSELAESGVKLCQVKSKFGSLRAYVHGESGSGIYKLIQEYELKSMKICEKCGEPGTQVSARGWVRTACEQHSK